MSVQEFFSMVYKMIVFNVRDFFAFLVAVFLTGFMSARTPEEVCVYNAIKEIRNTNFFEKSDNNAVSIRHNLKSNLIKGFAKTYQGCVEDETLIELYEKFQTELAEKIRSDFVKISEKHIITFPERSLQGSVEIKEKKLTDSYNFLFRSNRGQDHFMEFKSPNLVDEEFNNDKYLVCDEDERCLALRVNGLVEQDPDSILQRYFNKFSSTEGLTVILPPHAKNNQITTTLTQKIRGEICFRKGAIRALDRWQSFIMSAGDKNSMTLVNKIKQVYEELYRVQIKEVDFAAHLERAINMSIKSNVCGTFNPVALGHLVSFLEKFRKDPSAKWKILDPSAGWGDRYSSAAVLGSGKVDYYIGLDPNTHMRAVYEKIKTELERLRLKTKKKETHPKLMEVLTIGSEIVGYETQDRESRGFAVKDIIIDKNVGKITFKTKKSRPNLIFTSPPYFDLESYADEETQSSKKFPTLQEWLEGFLAVTVEKNINILEDGGFLAFNLADPKADEEMAIVKYLIEVVEQYPEMKFLGWVGLALEYRRNETSHQPVEPILIWQKNPSTSNRSSQSNLLSKKRNSDNISADESTIQKEALNNLPPNKKRRITPLIPETSPEIDALLQNDFAWQGADDMR